MRTPLALLAALLIGCPPSETPPDDKPIDEDPIVAGTETVSTSWDVDLFTDYESPSIPRFDTLGGRRQLDSMIIAVDHSAVMTLNVENGSDFALVADDYAVEFYLQSLIQLGRVESDEEGAEDPPFFGPGSFLAVVAVDLAAADDIPDAGADHHQETLTDTIPFEAPYDWVETPTYLEAMIGTEPLPLVVGGFSETWTYWNNYEDGSALLLAGASAVQYSGTMTVTYAYSPTEE